MNKILLVALFGFMACSPARCGEVANGLISIISKATTVKCVKSTLVLNGDQIYSLQTNNGQKIYVMAKCSGPRGDFAFLELRFSSDAKVEEYVVRGDLKDAYSKLKNMIVKIKIEDVKDENVRTTILYLIKHL